MAQPEQAGQTEGAEQAQQARQGVTRRSWGTAPDGRPITLYRLQNRDGLQAEIMDYGGVVVRLQVPDRQGVPGDIVLGHDHAAPYFDRGSSPYFGALIGRYGNRIARGRFTLEGETHQLTPNNGPNALHGGEGGFDQRLWEGRSFAGEDGPGVELAYLSPDGEEGYPGNLSVRVTYTLTHGNALQIDYEATTDAPTVLNLTNHTYWNLSGDAGRDILGHQLTVQADQITPVDATLIPTGELLPVEGTPFDFRQPSSIGARVGGPDEQLAFAGGYDHNFVLRGGGGLKRAAELHDPESGRRVEVLTDQPGMQFYSGNFLDGSIVGKSGQVYGQRWAVCLETQHFPDSPNQPAFPSTVLRPGERFTSRTVYAFSAR